MSERRKRVRYGLNGKKDFRFQFRGQIHSDVKQGPWLFFASPDDLSARKEPTEDSEKKPQQRSLNREHQHLRYI